MNLIFRELTNLTNNLCKFKFKYKIQNSILLEKEQFSKEKKYEENQNNSIGNLFLVLNFLSFFS